MESLVMRCVLWIVLLVNSASSNHMPWTSRVGRLSDPILSFDPFAIPSSSSSSSSGASSSAASSAHGASSSASSSARSGGFRPRSISSFPRRPMMNRGRSGQRGSNGFNYLVAMRRGGSRSHGRPRNPINSMPSIRHVPLSPRIPLSSRMPSSLRSQPGHNFGHMAIPASPVQLVQQQPAPSRRRVLISRDSLLNMLGISTHGASTLPQSPSIVSPRMPAGVVFLREKSQPRVQTLAGAPILMSGSLPVQTVHTPLTQGVVSSAAAASVSAGTGTIASQVPAAPPPPALPQVINIGGASTKIANAGHEFTLQGDAVRGGISLTGPGGTVTIGSEILNSIGRAGMGPIRLTEFEELEAEEPMHRNQNTGLKIAGNSGRPLILGGKTRFAPVRHQSGAVVISSGAGGNIIVNGGTNAAPAAASSASSSSAGGSSAASSSASAGGSSVEIISPVSSAAAASAASAGGASASAAASSSGGAASAAASSASGVSVNKNTGKGHVVRLKKNQQTVTIGGTGGGKGPGIHIPGNATFIVEG